jgi:hypothetical protein
VNPALTPGSEKIYESAGRRQIRPVDIIHLTDRPEKIAQVVSFGKTGQLRNIVEADIDDPLHSRFKQTRKKFLGRLLRKPDGKQFYLTVS